MTQKKNPELVYLITGGCGFLGRHIIRVLLEKEDQVAEIRVFDKQKDNSLTRLGTDKTKVTVIQGDITNYDSILNACCGVDVVIHSASVVDVWYKVPDDVIYSVNVNGTLKLIDACIANNICSLIYTSSIEALGPNTNRDPFIRGNENTPYSTKHTMAYPKSKLAAEKLVLRANGILVNNCKRLHTCSLRPTGIYGEGHELTRDLYKMAVKMGGIIIEGVPKSAEQGRVYAGNVAWMHVLAARALMEVPEKVGGEVFFCYDDSPYMSYNEFNMILFSSFKFLKIRVPIIILWFVSMFNGILRWLISPFYNFTPILNNYTLSVVSTPFTVKTDKARRILEYYPLYDWDQCRERTQKWVDTFVS